MLSTPFVRRTRIAPAKKPVIKVHVRAVMSVMLLARIIPPMRPAYAILAPAMIIPMSRPQLRDMSLTEAATAAARQNTNANKILAAAIQLVHAAERAALQPAIPAQRKSSARAKTVTLAPAITIAAAAGNIAPDQLAQTIVQNAASIVQATIFLILAVVHLPATASIETDTVPVVAPALPARLVAQVLLFPVVMLMVQQVVFGVEPIGTIHVNQHTDGRIVLMRLVPALAAVVR